jgi:hypothetical protein
MVSLGNRIKRSLALAPNVVLRKAAARAANAWRLAALRRRDQTQRSYDLAAPAVPLARLLEAPDAGLLAPHAATLGALADLYVAHRFDLLGSGWVQVRYGMECRGLRGHRFGPGPAVAADRAGRWLAQRVNAPNLAEAQRVWSLVDGGYAPIDWQLDFKSGYRWSATDWYRDVPHGAPPPGADVKVPWELARGQHLPQLALAARAFPARAATLAREFRSQVLDFIATNPPRFGVNWAVAMDVAIRATNWAVARDLFHAAGAAFDAEFEALLARSVREHARHVADNLEWSELRRGNHYLANISGLLFASAYLPADAETDAWLALGIQELARETELQFDPDGANFEASTCYHRLSAELVVYATAVVLGLPAARVDALRAVQPRRFPDGPRLDGPPRTTRPPGGTPRVDLPAPLAGRISRMAQFAVRVGRPDGSLPQIGDNDSGRLFRLSGPYDVIAAGDAVARYRHLDGYTELPPETVYPDERGADYRPLVAAANALAPQDELAACARGFELEAALASALARGARIDNMGPTVPPPAAAVGDPTALEATRARILGLAAGRRQRYEFAHPGRGLQDRLQAFAYAAFGVYVLRSQHLHLVIRCGALDPRTDGAHAHCDQLALDLVIAGGTRVVDPGTFLYTPLPETRDRYRSVAAHFAPRVAGAEPADLGAGPFVLRDHARARCLYFGARGFAGTHHGFGPAVLRAVTLEDDRVVVEDGSLGGPLERLDAAPAPPASPKYGALLR